MANIVSKTYNLKVSSANKDLTDREETELKVVSKLNMDNNSMTFHIKMPDHVFDYLKDSSEEYSTDPLEPEYPHSKAKPFINKITGGSLSSVLQEYQSYCNKALIMKDEELAVVEKYIAIKFHQSKTKRKDMYNFASLGDLVSSSFQYFVCYKDITKPGSLGRRFWKTKDRVGEERYSKGKNWFYYGQGALDSFQIIRWTQEREDFLKRVEDKLNSVNVELAKFLSDISEEKIEMLMKQEPLLLKQ